MKNIRKQSGFTLIEILVVIGIIAVLAAVVLIAINPARQFAQARDSQRTSNVNALINGIGQNMADNKGLIKCGAAAPTKIENVVTVLFDPTPANPIIATTGSNIASAAGVDLRPCLVSNYMSEISVDPQSPDQSPDDGTYDTNYRIFRHTGGRITVFAPNTEIATTLIEITR